jgi:hypothetical protein
MTLQERETSPGAKPPGSGDLDTLRGLGHRQDRSRRLPPGPMTLQRAGPMGLQPGNHAQLSSPREGSYRRGGSSSARAGPAYVEIGSAASTSRQERSSALERRMLDECVLFEIIEGGAPPLRSRGSPTRSVRSSVAPRRALRCRRGRLAWDLCIEQLSVQSVDASRTCRSPARRTRRAAPPPCS